MGEIAIWDVDRLAAETMLKSIGVEATPDALASAARHFARHRREMIDWGARRARRQITQMLDMTPPPDHGRLLDGWTQGFHEAEIRVATMGDDELLDLGPEITRSRGQILRQMVRQARAAD